MPAGCVFHYTRNYAGRQNSWKRVVDGVVLHYVSSAGFCGLLEVVQVTCLGDMKMMQQRLENPIRWLRTFLGHQSSLKMYPNAPILQVRKVC